MIANPAIYVNSICNIFTLVMKNYYSHKDFFYYKVPQPFGWGNTSKLICFPYRKGYPRPWGPGISWR